MRLSRRPLRKWKRITAGRHAANLPGGIAPSSSAQSCSVARKKNIWARARPAPRLVDQILQPLEKEWSAGSSADESFARMKRLRSAILPGLIAKSVSEAEAARRWRQLADIDVAERWYRQPPTHLVSCATPEQLLETVERIEEMILGRARSSRWAKPLRSSRRRARKSPPPVCRMKSAAASRICSAPPCSSNGVRPLWRNSGLFLPRRAPDDFPQRGAREKIHRSRELLHHRPAARQVREARRVGLFVGDELDGGA